MSRKSAQRRKKKTGTGVVTVRLTRWPLVNSGPDSVSVCLSLFICSGAGFGGCRWLIRPPQPLRGERLLGPMLLYRNRPVSKIISTASLQCNSLSARESADRQVPFNSRTLKT